MEVYEYLGYEKGYRRLDADVNEPIERLRLVDEDYIDSSVIGDITITQDVVISTIEYELIDHNHNQAFYRRIGNDEADDAKQLKKLEAEMTRVECPMKRKAIYDRIRALQMVVPTECCVCGDKMRGRSPQYSWCCSSSCVRQHCG